MEFYNHRDKNYDNILNNGTKQYYIKVELLSHWENVIGEISSDISFDDVGTININKEQGCRRSCSLSVVSLDGKYLPSSNSAFWYNRKFKIWTGVSGGTDTYWFSQGVFVTKSATAQGKIIHIDAIDKFGFLNGELNTKMCMIEYQANVDYTKKDTKIVDLIKDTLILDMGNGQPLDPIEPIIDECFSDEILVSNIVVNEGQYLGEIFTTLADTYGANVYYDTNGHLRFERVFNYDIPSYYRCMTPEWKFDDVNLVDDTIQIQYEFNGINTVTVASDNTTGEVYTYTAVNTNPQSPVNVYSVGTKGYDGGVVYIPLGDTSSSTDGEEKCKQYAEYLLYQNTMMNIAVSINYFMIPHLDVDHTITLNMNGYNLTDQLFIIQSITLPLGITEMQLEVSNVKWLPTDIDSVTNLS